ncbi:MAG: GNAT family N-acetyltransferase [Deltaproteobacteria bacterium]|nr:GNAT family N-acetyltransferase [Deltaproteobacteria bacterium]
MWLAVPEPDMDLDVIDARDPRAAATWRDLEARSPSSYFLSPAWVETWLASLPEDAMPHLAVTRDRSAACWLGRREVRRHGVLGSRAIFLNTTGFDRYDEVCIEHNKILGNGAALVAALPKDWDELFLPAVDDAAVPDLGALRGYRVHIDRESVAPFVDLDAVRASEAGYLSLLGSNTRNQVRRARRIIGDLEIELARDEASALDIYGELLRLHARTWSERGQHGAFADPWFERFHRRLITSRIATGEIQLMRVRAGAMTIGCLYNFVYRGRVLFYQSGLAHFDDAHVKPGYLCHAAAVEYNANAGHRVYDLLGGTTRYKQSLATGAQRLLWLRVQRPRLRFAVEEQLRSWKRALVPGPLALRPA